MNAQQITEQLKVIRQNNDDAKRIVIAATSGEIEIRNPQVIDKVLGNLLDELQTPKDKQNE